MGRSAIQFILVIERTRCCVLKSATRRERNTNVLVKKGLNFSRMEKHAQRNIHVKRKIMAVVNINVIRREKHSHVRARKDSSWKKMGGLVRKCTLATQKAKEVAHRNVSKMVRSIIVDAKNQSSSWLKMASPVSKCIHVTKGRMQVVNITVPRRGPMLFVLVRKDMYWKKMVDRARKFILVTIKTEVVRTTAPSRSSTNSLVNAIRDTN
jgi:hypothetical protein